MLLNRCSTRRRDATLPVVGLTGNHISHIYTGWAKINDIRPNAVFARFFLNATTIFDTFGHTVYLEYYTHSTSPVQLAISVFSRSLRCNVRLLPSLFRLFVMRISCAQTADFSEIHLYQIVRTWFCCKRDRENVRSGFRNF